jgi:PAS domain S-box-containing protein
MRWPWRDRRRQRDVTRSRSYVLATVAIAVFVLCLVSAGLRLISVERALTRDINENMLWFVGQAQFEALRFADAVSRYGAADPAVTQVDLRLRFDVMSSRLAVLADGPQRQRLAEAGVADWVAGTVTDLAALEPEIDRLTPGDAAAAQRIRERVELVIAELRDAANRTVHAERERGLMRRDHRRAVMLEVLAYIVGLLVSGAFLSLRLIVGLRAVARAEQSLRREKELSERLLLSSREGIVAFDRYLRCTLWNPSMESIFGIPASAVIGRRLPDVVPFFGAASVEPALVAAAAGRDAPCGDHGLDPASAVTTDAGAERVIETSCSTLHDGGGEAVGGIVFVRDMTERRRIEEALRQSQKMEAVGQLTGGVAHDFNNFLTAIAGNLDLLQRRLADDPRGLSILEAAQQAAEKSERLTQQLLAFSRKQPLNPERIDLNAVVRGVDDLLRQTVSNDLELRFSLAEDLAPGLADRNQLEVALLNLVINARDATPPGGRITIATGNVEITGREPAIADAGQNAAPGRYVRLSVSDTGAGIPPAVRARVFEPFFTTKGRGKGTGLGLSQVYGFVRQSDGHVAVESREGEGTTFALYLPLAETAAGRREADGTRERLGERRSTG